MNKWSQAVKKITTMLLALLLMSTGNILYIDSTYAAESDHDGGHSNGGHSGGGSHSGGGHSGGSHSGGNHSGGGHSGGSKGKGGHSSGEHPEDDKHDDSGDHGQRGPGGGFKGGSGWHVPSGIGDSPSPDSEGRGPRFGGGGHKPEPGTQGGRPSWAKEGIPHIELGRLNVARSPSSVLERAFNEVLTNWNPTLATYYSQSAASAAALLSTDYKNVTRIDSPLGNLGMYKDLLANDQTQLPDVTPHSTEDLAAILLGSASDKNIPITVETVKAINIILDIGTGLTESQMADIAGKADNVRSAILTGHGE